MDPITSAVLSALPALASEVVKSSVKDAYAGLKAVIRRKWGDHGQMASAIDALETDPESEGRATVLAEQVRKTKAVDDPDIMAAVNTLLAELGAANGGKRVAHTHIEISGGTVGVAGAETVTIGTLNLGVTPKGQSN